VPVIGALVVVHFFANHKTLRYIGVRGVRYSEKNRDGNNTSRAVQQPDDIVDNCVQYEFSYRFYPDLGNISCKFFNMETIANTNSNTYTSDACMVLTYSPQNLLSTGHYSVPRGTMAQKNVKCTVERIKKH